MKRRENLPEPLAIGDILDETLSKLGLKRELESGLALEAWNKVVSEEIAKITKPIKVEDDILFVKVSSAGWRNKLSFERENFRRKINEFLGKETVKEIRLI